MPNRSNYIHWLEDLLSSDLIPSPNTDPDKVIGFDIGTGANCIYPLLGASLLGWRFVASGNFHLLVNLTLLLIIFESYFNKTFEIGWMISCVQM